ncbi:uncharacterized protein V1518DRAFT_427537 [Limtongia smithiae]|uniref:uncharacterized protein n=1 Tax=Limtongia smithiae TaxID=1125753 RepID=UPI0034CE8401
MSRHSRSPSLLDPQQQQQLLLMREREHLVQELQPDVVLQQQQTTFLAQSQPLAESTSSSSSSAHRQSLSRMSSASPLPFDTRYLSKRAREIQAQDISSWPQLGISTSPLASPKRERDLLFDPVTVASQQQFSSSPELQVVQGGSALGAGFRQQRARAGTMPSRLSSSLLPPQIQQLPGSVPLQYSTSSNSRTDERSEMPLSLQAPGALRGLSPSPNITAHRGEITSTSRFRSGSLNLPLQRPPSLSALGSSILAQPSWSTANNDSSSLAASSSNAQPALSSFDYLGLDDSAQNLSHDIHALPEPPSRRVPSGLASTSSSTNAPTSTQSSLLADVARLRTDISRLRSYSVNATERYDPDSQSSSTLEGLIEETDEHRDLDEFHHLVSISSRPRSRTTVGPDIQSRVKVYQPHLRPEYTSTSTADASHVATSSVPDFVNVDESMLVNSLDDKSIGPTRTLWLGNLPPSITPSVLSKVFSKYGTIEYAQLFASQTSGFINFTTTDSSIQAKVALSGTELVPGSGGLKIGFAKLKGVAEPPTHAPAGTSEDQSENSAYDAYPSAQTGRNTPSSLQDMEVDVIQMVKEYGATDEHELLTIRTLLHDAFAFSGFIDELPPLPEPNPNRIYDAPRLREVRKRIDNGNLLANEIEAIALEMLDEIAELASDYLGNTVVQKLFECCSEPVKTLMLQQLAPYLAQLGVHKNGTWAAQKVIDVARTNEQMMIISNALHPYTVHLFLDQFGNYVLQCCLRFGAPFNDFIFKSMLSEFSQVAQGRFGARAMRACLESHYATKEQQRVLAAAITLNAVQLATNANGALLLTWFLDTCTLPNRHRVLAPRLIPHLVQLCTHKLASLTVLKVVNYRSEPSARAAIIDGLVSKETVLQEILSDNANGPTVILKILTAPLLEPDVRQHAVSAVRKVLMQLTVQQTQGYRRLMDEVGLSARALGGANVASSNGSTNGNSGSIHGGKSGYHHGHGGHRGNHGAHQHENHKGSVPHMQQQHVPYYGNIYEQSEYSRASNSPVPMEYLAIQMEGMGISAEQQYATSPVLGASLYPGNAFMQPQQQQQQAPPQQSQQSSFYPYMSPISSPPSTYDQAPAYMMQQSPNGVPYSQAEQFREQMILQQLSATNGGSGGVYPNYMYSSYTPVFSPSPSQGGQQQL